MTAALKIAAETKPARKTAPRKTAKAVAKTANNHKPYAIGGVVLMSVLSALLNGYANSTHATVAWAGWGMGIVIPAIVLILAKVAGGQWKAGQVARAKITGGAGLGLLVLSVWHCAQSIALLTGGNLWLALPMAVAIDMGLVCCEVATLDD